MHTTYKIFTVLIAAIMALMAVRWIYFRILAIAKKKNVVDNPNARKLQKQPVPVMGGIAVFFGVLAGLLVGTSVYALPFLLSHEPVDLPSSSLLSVLAAMGIMLYMGAIDDMIGLSAVKRLLIEMGVVLGLIMSSGGCIDTFRGMWGIGALSWWIAVPLTIFAGVGIINAINMIDGVNGLSSGICMTCSILFGVAFIRIMDWGNAVLAFSMAAALLPFFIHNVFGSKSRMFIGDAGTMVMGILMTWFTISTLRAPAMTEYYTPVVRTNMVAMCLAILSVPVFDTLRVMVMRMLKGFSPFKADMTHLHHTFIQIGVSHSITALIEILIDGVVFGVWGVCVLLRVNLDWQLYIVLMAALLMVWGTYFFLHYHTVHQTALWQRMTQMSRKTHLGHTAWWLRFQAFLDSPEVIDPDDEGHHRYENNHEND
ncbi:MAG: glycosyltransferase family 4 protein [Paludibacteraceae bacterium]